MRPAGPPHARIGWLVTRPDYVAMNSAAKFHTPFFTLQVRPKPVADAFAYRVGFTTSRKVGNAVIRNRCRRRLRELVRHQVPVLIKPQHDLVFIARTAAASVPFALLQAALQQAATRLKIMQDVKE